MIQIGKEYSTNDLELLEPNSDFQEPTHDLWNSRDSYDFDEPLDVVEANIQATRQFEQEQRAQCGEHISTSDDSSQLVNGASDNHSRIYKPGYTFAPPSTWNVPQRRAPACLPDRATRPSAVFDRGTPTNVLELDPNGNMATTENFVHQTNVGSILPKFTYQEHYD